MPKATKAQQREYQRQWIKERRAEFFTGKCCVQCGATERLELDHINPEEKTSHYIWSWSKERRDAEIAKCQVLCRPCHQRKTTEQSYAARQHGTVTMYQKGPCRCVLCRWANANRVRKGRGQALLPMPGTSNDNHSDKPRPAND